MSNTIKFFILVISLIIPVILFSSERTPDIWFRSGANSESTKLSPYNQITNENISNLTLAWQFHGGALTQVETNPIFTGNNLVTAFDNILYSINPKTGIKNWATEFDTKIAKRGLTYFNNFLYVPTDAGVYEIEEKTGKKIRKFGSETSFLPPILTDKFLITANFTSVQAWDINENNKIWEVALNKDGVNTRIWSGLSYDQENKIAYIVTSNSGYLEDADIKEGGYSSSLLAINAINGKIIWQFQDIKHDLWDLDVVGPPIILNIEIEKKLVPAVAAVTKSGNVLFLNRINGRPIFPIETIKVAGPNDENPFLSKNQLLIKKPEPFSDTFFNVKKDINNINPEKKAYVSFKLRNVKEGKFLPFSSKYDVVMFGLHGGAEWPGAAISNDKKVLIIPSNKYPWIFRKTFFDKDEKEAFKFSSSNATYLNKCAVCHGGDLKGARLSETEGDYYFPSLAGITYKKDQKYLSDLNQFHKDHFYVSNSKHINQEQFNKLISKVNLKLGDSRFAYKVKNKIKEWSREIKESNNTFIKNIAYAVNNKFHMVNQVEPDNSKENKFNIFLDSYINILNSVNEKDLKELNNFFEEIDKTIWSNNHQATETFWQLLLDQDGLPGSNPPWGFITGINLVNGKTLWKIPFGFANDSNNHKRYMGDMNFGGVMTTASNIFFANGTRDSYAYAYNVSNGQKIWEVQLPAGGSAPPMSYYYNGCQYIVFTATGNKFFGFIKRSDSILAYKLREC